MDTKADLEGAPGGQLSAQLTILLLGTSIHVSGFLDVCFGASGKVGRDDAACCTL